MRNPAKRLNMLDSTPPRVCATFMFGRACEASYRPSPRVVSTIKVGAGTLSRQVFTGVLKKTSSFRVLVCGGAGAAETPTKSRVLLS